MKNPNQIHASNYGILNKTSLLFALTAFVTTAANSLNGNNLLPLWLLAAICCGFAGYSVAQAGDQKWRSTIMPTALYAIGATACFFYPFPA
jgi:amino acid transporter